MTTEELTELAEKEAKLAGYDLETKLTELKALDFSILECIIYIKINQNCSLSDAKTLVVNSAAWIDQKDQFISHQQEQLEEFIETAKNNIHKIEHIYSSDKTEINVRFKPNK